MGMLALVLPGWKVSIGGKQGKMSVMFEQHLNGHATGKKSPPSQERFELRLSVLRAAGSSVSAWDSIWFLYMSSWTQHYVKGACCWVNDACFMRDEIFARLMMIFFCVTLHYAARLRRNHQQQKHRMVRERLGKWNEINSVHKSVPRNILFRCDENHHFPSFSHREFWRSSNRERRTWGVERSHKLGHGKNEWN